MLNTEMMLMNEGMLIIERMLITEWISINANECQPIKADHCNGVNDWMNIDECQ